MICMPLLCADSPLPHTPRQVLVAGVTGVGKSTLSAQLSERWNLPYTGMDVLHWGPCWTPRPDFHAQATALAQSAQWVTEWQYWSKGFKHILGDRGHLHLAELPPPASPAPAAQAHGDPLADRP